jgi:hypothetical protein
MTGSGFDISSKEFAFKEIGICDFAADLAFGHVGEDYVRKFLSAITTGDYEVKTDRYRNGRMVIETNQNPRGLLNSDGERVWVTSGINVTTAKWWVYIFSIDGAFLVLDVERVKRFLRFNRDKFNESTKINLGSLDNPARGFLLYPNHVSDLMTNPNYDIE